MEFLLTITILLSISAEHVHGAELRSKLSSYHDELRYQELKDMNISCYPYDSCSSKDEKYENAEPIPPNKCSCHSQCWEYGTCCIDSPYRVKRPIYKCIFVGVLKSYYMVHKCPDSTRPDSIWKIHCERKWDNENDILMLSPVTSLETSQTYKNYYCFRCHEEETSKFLSWNLEVDSREEAPEDATVHSVFYNQTEETWVVVFEEYPTSIPVSLRFQFPNDMPAIPVSCSTAFEISDCPKAWDDRRVREKCLEYRSVFTHKFSSYRNAHCALCNSVALDKLGCEVTRWGGGGSIGGLFRCMMDIGGGDSRACFKNEEGTCKGKNQIWNKYSKECQELKCLFPGYVVKDNACVKP